MNDHDRELIIMFLTHFVAALIIVAVLLVLAAVLPGCYSNGTFGHMEFPLTLLPESAKTEDVKKTIEADPTTMIVLQFNSVERLVGGASVQNSKKDVEFLIYIPGFMTIQASGGRSIEEAEVDAAPLIEATGAAVGEAAQKFVGIP